MATIISLFESEAESTKALDALYQREFGDVEIDVIEHQAEVIEEGSAVVPTAPNAATDASGLVDMPSRLVDIDFKDEEEAEFFTSSIRNRGVLVVADVDDEHADEVEELFRSYGGRTSEED